MRWPWRQDVMIGSLARKPELKCGDLGVTNGVIYPGRQLAGVGNRLPPQHGDKCAGRQRFFAGRASLAASYEI